MQAEFAFEHLVAHQLGVEPGKAPETAGRSAATGSTEENAAPIGSAAQEASDD